MRFFVNWAFMHLGQRSISISSLFFILYRGSRLACVVLGLGISSSALLCGQPVHSPYTTQEIGEFIDHTSATHVGMGQVGVALASSPLQMVQPALLSYNRLTHIYFGLVSDMRQVKSPQSKTQSDAVQIGVLAMSFPLLYDRWGLRLSLSPYTQVNYHLERESSTADVLSARISHRLSGSGGIDRLSLAQGLRLSSSLHVGVSLAYYFGSIRREDFLFTSEDRFSDFGVNYEERIYYQGLGYELGVYYTIPLSEARSFNLGAILSPSTRLEQSMQTLVTRGLSNFAGTQIGTPLSTESPVADYMLPWVWKLGLGYQHKETWQIGLDMHSSFFSSSYRNSWRLALGFSYLPDQMSLSYLKRIPYRVGVSGEALPYSLSGATLQDLSAYLGSSLRVRNKAQLDVGLRMGIRGLSSSNRFEEQYLQLHIGTTLSNQWFIRPKYD